MCKKNGNGRLRAYSPYGEEYLKYHMDAPREVRENALALVAFAVREYAQRAKRYAAFAKESREEIDRLNAEGKRIAAEMRLYPRAQLNASNRNTADLLAETRHMVKLEEKALLYRRALSEARRAMGALEDSLERE